MRVLLPVRPNPNPRATPIDPVAMHPPAVPRSTRNIGSRNPDVLPAIPAPVTWAPDHWPSGRDGWNHLISQFWHGPICLRTRAIIDERNDNRSKRQACGHKFSTRHGGLPLHINRYDGIYHAPDGCKHGKLKQECLSFASAK